VPARPAAVPAKRPVLSLNGRTALVSSVVKSRGVGGPARAGTSRPSRLEPAGMPLARHPDPEEVECLIRNGELRTAIEPYLDESIWEIDFHGLPTPVANRFLESIRRWRCSRPARSTTSRCGSGCGW
jgi:hypothetical protein